MAGKAQRALWSRIAAGLLAIILPLSTISFWAVYTVTNTDRWVATLQPLATNPTITNYIAEEGASTIVTQLNVENRIAKVLPGPASFLATTITTQFQNTIARALGSALQSSAFQKLWEKENRFTHSTAVAILSGDENQNISKARKIVINVTPAITSAIDKLDAQGITFLDPLKKKLNVDRVLALNLLNEKELQQAQRYFHLATTLEWLLPFLSLLLAALVVVLAKPRRQGFRRVSLVVLFSSAVAYGLLRIGIALATPLSPTPADVTKAILNAVTHYLGRELLILTTLGALGLIACWFTGPTKGAVATRHQIAGAIRAVRSGISRGSQQITHKDWKGWSQSNGNQLASILRVSDVVVAVAVVFIVLFWIGSFWGLVILVLLTGGYYWLSHQVHATLDQAPPALGEGSMTSEDAVESDATK